MKTIGLLVLVAVLTNGCAAMFHGTHDTITVHSEDENTRLYVNNQYIGKGHGQVSVRRSQSHEIRAKRKGCRDAVLYTSSSFDAVSIIGAFFDLGIISMLVVDWAATGAIQKTDPLYYTPNPDCDSAG